MPYLINITPADTPSGQTGEWYYYSVIHDRTDVEWFSGMRQGTIKEVEHYVKDAIKRRKNSMQVIDYDRCMIDIVAGTFKQNKQKQEALDE